MPKDTLTSNKKKKKKKQVALLCIKERKIYKAKKFLSLYKKKENVFFLLLYKASKHKHKPAVYEKAEHE